MKKLIFSISMLCLSLASFAQQFDGPNNFTDPIWREGRVNIGSNLLPIGELSVLKAQAQVVIGDPALGKPALRFIGSYPNGYAFIQAGTSFADPNARLRISRYGSENFNLADFQIYSDRSQFFGQIECTKGNGYLQLNPEDGGLDIASGNDGLSFIDFKGNTNLNADFTGRLLHRDGDGFYMNSTGPNTLNVNGRIRAKAIKVEIAGNWSDYVFEPTYNLHPLETVEAFIKENKHLPNIPSACDMETNGIDVAAMLALQMEKIEELTLYLIELKKQNDTLKTRVSNLENR
jgi:hypothetical protein